MDGFTYHNLFDTKGTEYLVVIAFLILIIPLWYIMKEKGITVARMARKLGILSSRSLNVPQGLLYSSNHTWLYMERSGMVKMGLNDLLVHLTGKIALVPLKQEGEEVTKGEVVAKLIQDNKSLNVCSPLTGKIMAANSILADEPHTINIDPYGKGWIYNIIPEKWKDETADLYQTGESEAWLSKELDRFKDFLSMNMNSYATGDSSAVLMDGGELYDHCLSMLPDSCWKDFEKEFCQL